MVVGNAMYIASELARLGDPRSTDLNLQALFPVITNFTSDNPSVLFRMLNEIRCLSCLDFYVTLLYLSPDNRRIISEPPFSAVIPEFISSSLGIDES